MDALLHGLALIVFSKFALVGALFFAVSLARFRKFLAAQ